MIGRIQDYQGRWMELPPLMAWDFYYADGSCADSFSVEFRYDGTWEERLRGAIRFQAVEGEHIRFQGIVDEYEITKNAKGVVGMLYGRGMMGLLLDNQVGQREYYYARLSDMIRKYVTPYGIASPTGSRNFYLPAYAVDYGESAWDAFSGFCLWGAKLQPRFLPDGTLVISGDHGKGQPIMEDDPIVEVVRTNCRYGVYSSVVAKYIATGYEQKIENTEFRKRGGCATYRMTIPRRNRCRAGLRSAAMELENSRKKESGLTVTLSEPFWAQPMDEVQVDLKQLGLAGTFLVREAKNSGDASGNQCCLSMYQM